MQVKERTRQEIEAKLGTMGDYVKLDYLQRALSSSLDFETRKFVQLKLSKMYEERGMYPEAAKLMKAAAEINTTFRGKIQDYMKSVELFIKGGLFQDADMMFSQAIALGNEREKTEIRTQVKQVYLAQAQELFAKDKRSHAKKFYEKILTLDLSPSEKKQVQENLMQLYQKLGNIREFYKIRDSS